MVQRGRGETSFMGMGDDAYPAVPMKTSLGTKKIAVMDTHLKPFSLSVTHLDTDLKRFSLSVAHLITEGRKEGKGKETKR